MNTQQPPKPPLRTTCKTIPFLLGAFLLGGVAGRFFGEASDGHRPPPQQMGDAALVKSLLGEKLSERTFDFATIAEACSGKHVLPLTDEPAHLRVTAAIEQALADTILELNAEDSPVRTLRRINEASRFFENKLLVRINSVQGLRCEVPPTRAGIRQRSGYPDLRITDIETGAIFYLDPKLVEQGSESDTLRTFYFEPKDETLKITNDAVHLLAGIEHDGHEGQWTFTGWRLVDLSTLKVRLKAEFQSSNADLYRKSRLSLPRSTR